MATVKEKMTAIADAIRDKTRGTELLTLDDMADEIPNVYKAGKDAQYDEFWDIVQQNGNRTSYIRAFSGVLWTNEVFKPKYDIKPKYGGATAMFQGCSFEGNLREHLENLGRTLDVSGLNGTTNLFSDAVNITETPFLDFSNVYTYVRYVFSACTSLKTAHIKLGERIAEIRDCFTNCTALENLIVEGTIGVNGFDVHWSTKLSRSSILSILQACNIDAAGVTITLPTKCIDGITVTETYIANDTEMATALANAKGKGYTVAFN